MIFILISNFPFLGKVVEKVIAQQLQSFLDEIDYLDPLQSGFRPGYGHTFDHSGGSRMEVVHTPFLYDCSVAFNTISYGILLEQLGGWEWGSIVLSWFASFLWFLSVDRKREVWPLSPALGCVCAIRLSIFSLLLNIYMKPLDKTIDDHGLIHQYMDDTQLYV